jgi:hypothetical protein
MSFQLSFVTIIDIGIAEKRLMKGMCEGRDTNNDKITVKGWHQYEENEDERATYLPSTAGVTCLPSRVVSWPLVRSGMMIRVMLPPYVGLRAELAGFGSVMGNIS